MEVASQDRALDVDKWSVACVSLGVTRHRSSNEVNSVLLIIVI